MMLRKSLSLLALAMTFLTYAPRSAAADWDPVTDAEKSMKSNPLDPGAGAVVLFKRGEVDVLEKTSLFWTTRIVTYVRIKVFNDAGREAANVSEESPKFVRLSRVEGRTILPSGETIPLDSSKVFRGKSYEEGKHFAQIRTSFTLPSVEPGSIVEYQIEENEDWFFPPPWIFDTRGIGTLQSTLKVIIAPRLAMSQFQLDTTVNKIAVARKQTVQGTQLDFSVNNLHPIEREAFSLPFRDLATMIVFSPREMAFGGDAYPVITKWDDVATVLTKEENNTEKNAKEAKSKAKEVAEKLPDPRKKAEAIYEYIQQNIASSDLRGVHLYRTADDVLNSKRADPDEINALFIVMLKEVKIDADMVLLATRNWQTLIRSFPNYSQFSTIVARVNFKDGAVFADPSDPAAPFGDLPWFDRDVTGLAVKGSKIQEAPIPPGTMDDNVSTVKIAMQVAKDWTTEGDEEIEMKGAEAIDFRGDLMGEAPQKLEEDLNDFFAFGHSDATVTQVTHPEFRDSSQPFILKAHVKEKLTNEAGPGELLLNPWLDDQYERPLFKTNVRHSTVRFNNPERRISTSTWQVAPEIKVEQLPKDVKIDGDIGGFSHSCTQNGATVTCTRTYYLKKTMLQTTGEYLNAKKLFDEIAKQDQEVILLRAQ